MARRIATFLMLLTIISFPALAKEAKGNFDFGAYVGYGFLDGYCEDLPAPVPKDGPLLGARFGYFFSEAWSAEVSFQRLSTETNSCEHTCSSDFEIDSVRGNALYTFRPGKPLRPFATLGIGLDRSRVPSGPGKFSSSDPSFNAGGGLRWFLTYGFGLRFDARYVTNEVGGLPGDVSTNNFETGMGVFIAFGGPPADDDNDGVRNKNDDCPDTPQRAQVDLNGCPIDSDGDGVFNGLDECADTPTGAEVDPKGCPIDNDGDGVPNGIDQCPDTLSGAVVDAQGCPVDSDEDGVPDGIDECPDTPVGATVDELGCPVDSDGDGVPDGIDECPDTPQEVIVDEVGCPVDSDGDGVPDGIDECPDTAQGVKVDDVGCPLPFEAALLALGLEGVKFKVNTNELTDDSKATLDSVAEGLAAYPDVLVEVAGYTDSSGDESYNQQLSQKRADAVRDYMVGRGVNASQLMARGYGEADPVADNETQEGRERNRRVVLRKK